MTLYGFVLFVHVVFAILLVGGSAYAHLSIGLVRRARTVEGLRSHVATLHAIVKSSMPIAMVVLAAGLYMAFAGDWWGAGWPVVSLVLFALGGAAAGGILDPRVAAMRERLEERRDGPVTAELRAELQDRTLTIVTWALGGADLAIVFLMTNKPGWTGSVVAGAVGIGLGLVVAMRELAQHTAPIDPAPASPAS